VLPTSTPVLASAHAEAQCDRIENGADAIQELYAELAPVPALLDQLEDEIAIARIRLVEVSPTQRP
jgi:hypothetical protein